MKNAEKQPKYKVGDILIFTYYNSDKKGYMKVDKIKIEDDALYKDKDASIFYYSNHSTYLQQNSVIGILKGKKLKEYELYLELKKKFE